MKNLPEAMKDKKKTLWPGALVPGPCHGGVGMGEAAAKDSILLGMWGRPICRPHQRAQLSAPRSLPGLRTEVTPGLWHHWLSGLESPRKGTGWDEADRSGWKAYTLVNIYLRALVP